MEFEKYAEEPIGPSDATTNNLVIVWGNGDS